MRTRTFACLASLLCASAAFAGDCYGQQLATRPDAALLQRVNQERQALREQWPGVRLEGRGGLGEMLALPTTGEPLSVDRTTQAGEAIQKRIAAYRSAVTGGTWRSWFNPETLPPPRGENELVALAERPDGWDSFGMPFETPWAVGYIRVTYNHLYICMLLRRSPSDLVPAGELMEYSEDELDQLDRLDRDRYLLARDAIRPIRQAPKEQRVSWVGGGPAGGPAPLTEMSASQEESVRRALAAVRLVCSERARDVTRYPWQVFDWGHGLLGKSVASFKPPPTPDYLQEVRSGFLVRFYVSGDLLCLAFSRYACVYRPDDVPKSSPGTRSVRDWFSRDVDLLDTTPPGKGIAIP